MFQRKTTPKEASEGFNSHKTAARKPRGDTADSPFWLQAKLNVASANNVYEQEADAIANQVMRQTVSSVQRRCACGGIAGADGECAACKAKRLQREVASSSAPSSVVSGSEAPASVHQTLAQPGQALDTATRHFMESRFGQDFSHMRVHTDSQAVQSAADVNATAYTVGNNVVFGAGQYHPQSDDGKRLIAHELAHVMQTNDNTNAVVQSVQRKVANNSNCPANVHGAPADPLARIAEIDAEAQRKALGASNSLFLEAIIFDDPTFGKSKVFEAYRDFFGLPTQNADGKWESRFGSTVFDNQNDAIEHEMLTLSERFAAIHSWLTKDIRYVCPGTSIYTQPGCRPQRCQKPAESCPGGKTIGVCPTFWGNDAGLLASLIIHEAVHAHFGYKEHPTGSNAGRGRNAFCYQAFVDTLYETGVWHGECKPGAAPPSP